MNETKNPISVAIAAALDCPPGHIIRESAVNILIDCIREHRGSVGHAATELGVTRQDMHTWLDSSRNDPDPKRRDLSELFGALRTEMPAQIPQAARPPSGGHNCPWLISDRAADDYCRLRPHKERVEALAELRGYILDIVRRNKEAKLLASGHHQYRSGAPLRCRIIVDPSRVPPEVVEVKPDHEGREGAYSRGSKGRPR